MKGRNLNSLTLEAYIESEQEEQLVQILADKAFFCSFKVNKLQIRGFKTDTKVPVLLLLLKMPLLEEFYYDDFLSITALNLDQEDLNKVETIKVKKLSFSIDIKD